MDTFRVQLLVWTLQGQCFRGAEQVLYESELEQRRVHLTDMLEIRASQRNGVVRLETEDGWWVVVPANNVGAIAFANPKR